MNVDGDVEERSYIFKSIDKLFYDARDTKILEQELQYLKLFRHFNIVQLVSIIISGNPYHTSITEDPCSILQGFLWSITLVVRSKTR